MFDYAKRQQIIQPLENDFHTSMSILPHTNTQTHCEDIRFVVRVIDQVEQT